MLIMLEIMGNKDSSSGPRKPAIAALLFPSARAHRDDFSMILETVVFIPQALQGRISTTP